MNGYTFYYAVLAPKLWRLTLFHNNQIFLDKSIPEIIEELLRDGGVTPNEYDLKLTRSYPKLEYVCQYRESHFTFFSRLLEREGLYYFFKMEEHTTKLIITDSKIAHIEMPRGETLRYAPPSGLEYEHLQTAVRSFNCLLRPMPAAVIFKNYNYRAPSLKIQGQAKAAQAHRNRGNIRLWRLFSHPHGREKSGHDPRRIPALPRTAISRGKHGALCPLRLPLHPRGPLQKRVQ